MRIILVIPALDAITLNKWFKENIDPIGGDETFNVELSKDRTSEVTAYWCSIGPLTTHQQNLITANFNNIDVGNGRRFSYTDTTTEKKEVLSALQLKTIEPGA